MISSVINATEANRSLIGHQIKLKPIYQNSVKSDGGKFSTDPRDVYMVIGDKKINGIRKLLFVTPSGTTCIKPAKIFNVVG